MKETIAADAFVENADAFGVLGGLQTVCQVVGPACIAVCGRTSAVGNGIAEDRHGALELRVYHVDPCEEIPVVDGL